MATSFKQMTTMEPKTVMLVDSLNLGFRWKHSGAKVFVDDYLHTVDSFAKSFKASKVIILADQGSSSYRREIFPDWSRHQCNDHSPGTAHKPRYSRAPAYAYST